MLESDVGPCSLLTIGHSTRKIEAFVSLLKAHAVTLLVDVRTIPRSRHNPQFEAGALAESLARAGVGYQAMPGLGGLRRARSDSPNTAWRNASFRGYADYMGTPAFAEALEGLIELAKRQTTAIMCAEAVPWRCHRSLIADAMVARGCTVEHVLGPGRTQPHRLNPAAVVAGGMITYPGEAGVR